MTTTYLDRWLTCASTKSPKTTVSDEATLFANVVSGRATPFETLIDDWLKEGAFAGRTEAAYRQAVASLTSWCASNDKSPTIEAITKRIAGQFIRERFIDTNAAPATANKAVTALASFCPG